MVGTGVPCEPGTAPRWGPGGGEASRDAMDHTWALCQGRFLGLENAGVQCVLQGA